MAKKKKKRRPVDGYVLPAHIQESRNLSARLRAKPRPALPQRRMILASFGMGLFCVGMALFLWLPAQSLVQDLRSRGIPATATVIGVDSKPKYVRVRLVTGPEAGTETDLSEYAGMVPATHTGASMTVIYDTKDPSRLLSRSWVTDPPTSLQTYLCLALALFFLVTPVFGIVRRRQILRMPEELPVFEPVRLTKP